MMKTIVSSLAEVLGAAAVCVGTFTWDLGLGLVTCGLFVLAGVRQASRQADR